MWSGVIVGLCGAVFWLGIQSTALGASPWFYINRCPPASVSPDCGFEFFAPLLLGPPAGFFVSIILGTWVDRALPRRGVRSRLAVLAFATAVYGAVTGLFWLLSRAPDLILHSLPPGPEGTPLLLPFFPLILTGLNWSGPASILVWSLLGGLAHACLWRAAPASAGEMTGGG
jgi:hypothetical protein